MVETAERLQKKTRCKCFLCGDVQMVTLPHMPAPGLWFCNSCEINDEDYVFVSEHGHLPGDADGEKSAYIVDVGCDCHAAAEYEQAV